MSLNIILQYNSTDDDHLDKDLRTIYTLTGNLRNDTDIVNPTILIECDPVYLFGDANVPGVNYFTISDFRRSYYLVNLNILETGLYELVGHVDVLSSFKDGIRAQEAIVRRQETASAYNLYINDASLKAYQNPHVITKKFPRGFNGFSYVLSIAGVAGATPVDAPSHIEDLTVTDTSATAFGHKYTLTWSAASNAVYYRVFKRAYVNGNPQEWHQFSSNDILTNTAVYDNQLSWGECDVGVVAFGYGSTWSNIVHLTAS